MGTIGRTNTGGGSLNLTIFASVEQPAIPVENMVWFNTDTAIPHWYFQNTAPSNPEVGDVYVTLSSTSTNVLQILRNNGIHLYFGTPRQWDGTNWNIIGGKIYYNDAWHNLQTFVYDGTIGSAENNFNHTVGGYPWSKTGGCASSRTDKASYFNCYWHGGTGGDGTFYAPRKIDFTAIKTVKITYTASGEGRSTVHQARVFTSGNTSGTVASVDMGSSSSKKTVTLNTANVTGEYYLGFYVYSDVSGYQWSWNYNIYSIELIG